MNKTLNGKIAIITGANQGLGLEIAKIYVIAGANVMLCARDAVLLQEVQFTLNQLAMPNQRIAAQACDVSVETDVKSLVDETIKTFGGYHILVNNAGIYGPKGESESTDWADWVKTIEVNLFGSILMCRASLAHFKAQAYGKIIQLSGGGATNPLPMLSAYAASKAAIVRFAETLAEEVRGTGIDVNAIAPGALNTRLLEEILEAGPEKVGTEFYERSLKQKESGGTPLSKAADLALFLASAASDGITGKLISAVWDNWETWPSHIDDLAENDIYTLRRIAGRDRGFTWGDR